MDVNINYTPQAKQLELHESPANEILFGGAAGPGKSHALRFEGLKWCMLIPGLQCYLFRRTLPELEKNHVIPSQEQFPRAAGSFLPSKKRWNFKNGSMLHFGYCQYEKDVFDYQGAEIHLLLYDELTTFTEFIYDYLRGRVRCTLDIPDCYKHKIPGIIAGSNPGGVGHQFVKKRWVDFCGKDGGMRRADEESGGMLRQYIPAKIKDNPILIKSDPGYIKRLKALPEPYRTAYLEGDWDIFMGQIFNFNEHDHVIAPMPVPEDAPLYMTYDWGFGKPLSIMWWWLDSDGRKYGFAEWYGCESGQVDKGLRLSDDAVAEGIVEREKAEGIWGRKITRLCDPTCFNKKPNPMEGGQLPSTAAIFAQHRIYLLKGNPNRLAKIRQFHVHLRKKEGELPMLVVYRTCEAFIRTIPLLQADRNNPEDVNTKMEDHCFSSDTEILTDEGWKFFYNLTEKEKVATLTIDNRIEYHKPYDYISRYHKGEMYVYEKTINFSVTSRHRFPIYTRSGDRGKGWRHKEIRELTRDYFYLPAPGEWIVEDLVRDIRLPLSGKPNSNEIEQLNLEVFFLYYGLWLSDGCITQSSRTHYRVNIDKAIDLTSIFDALGYRYHKQTLKDNKAFRWTIQSRQFYEIIRKQCGEHPMARTKYIPRWMLDSGSRLLRQLYNGLMLGDGSYLNGRPVYYTVSDSLADDFQELCFKLGYRANIRKFKNNVKEINGKKINSLGYLYRISVLKTENPRIVAGDIKREDYEGNVYCVRVKNETVYVRRKGTAYWSSNCYDCACHVLMARPVKKSGAGRRIGRSAVGLPADMGAV